MLQSVLEAESGVWVMMYWCIISRALTIARGLYWIVHYFVTSAEGGVSNVNCSLLCLSRPVSARNETDLSFWCCGHQSDVLRGHVAVIQALESSEQKERPPLPQGGDIRREGF